MDDVSENEHIFIEILLSPASRYCEGFVTPLCDCPEVPAAFAQHHDVFESGLVTSLDGRHGWRG